MRFVRLLYCLLAFSAFFHTLLPVPGLADDYLVGAGDVLKIDVYDNPDLKTTVRVTNDGKIVMPLLGQVKVGGLIVSDVAKKLTRLLADGYLVNPQVNIFIEDFRSKKAIILGQVARPGIVEIRGTTTFLEAISNAGGLKEVAGDVATIKRISGKKPEVIVVDIKSIVEGGDLSHNIPIHDGDTIYISKGGMCYVTGEVKNPDAYSCDKDTTVLKLIARSGGFTGKASKSSIRIVRLVDGEKTIFKDVDLHSQLQANDIIVVPESFF
ncbi:MAG: periplasmic polysaccharide biosynthesis/export protein [Desulfocapsa sp.]|nr:MAG: periplasmic polysaccharide biosynthesis/export protein [Desulfocapsa sp.]